MLPATMKDGVSTLKEGDHVPRQGDRGRYSGKTIEIAFHMWMMESPLPCRVKDISLPARMSENMVPDWISEMAI